MTGASASLDAGAAPAANARLLAAVVATAFFVEQMDATVLVTALPAITTEFGVNPVSGNLLLTSYLLSLTAFLPACGRLAELFGIRTIFCAAMAVFTFASALCSLSDSMVMLIAARLLQGVGAAMLSPVGRLLLLRSVPKSELVRAMSWVLIPTMIAPILGPLVGGFLVTFASWRWIFWINVPIGLIGIAMAWLLVREPPERPEPAPIDLRGALLCGGALAGVVVGLETLVHNALDWRLSLAAAAGGLASAGAYLAHARRHPAPLLNLGLMRIRTFSIATRAGVLFRIGIAAFPFLLPLMLQLNFGMSALASGAITFASGVSALAVKLTTVPILRRLGYRRVMIANGVLCALFLALCAALRPGWPIVAIYAVMLLGGFVRSLQFNAFGTIAFADMKPAQMADATSLHSVVQQLAAVLGISIAAMTLAVAGGLRGAGPPALGDFSIAFAFVAALALWSAWICAQLREGDGSELSAANTCRRAVMPSGER